MAKMIHTAQNLINIVYNLHFLDISLLLCHQDKATIVQEILTDDAGQFMVLPNLDGYKNYTVTVTAINKMGVSRESRPIAFQTPIRGGCSSILTKIQIVHRNV